MNQGKVIHYSQVEAEVAGDGAAGASIRWLIDEEHDGAGIFVMRMIELEPGGYSPHHTHPYEHQNFVVDGHGELRLGEEIRPLGPGDVALVPAGLRHQYRNTGSTTLRFLCFIPAEKFRS